ncbi:CopG family ribbon-helix-helix protein [Rhizobium sp. RAF36]|jgi:predicted transcriptional regulator|uniref:CopG family ribbon-helix-helix protein n=1 Tax=Rhizobium sp. RAF36 TaxID=3233055 RepID=UPI003F98A78E
MTLLSFQVDQSTISRLDRLAERRKLSPEEVATLAIEEFVEREEWQISEIEAAVREADKGDFASADEVDTVLSKYTAPPTER